MPPPWVVSGTGAKAATAVGGCALLLGLAAHSVVKATSEPPTPAPLQSAEVTTIVDAEAAMVLEPECDCAPLWECMQKESGSCGLLEKQLRDCLVRNKRT